MKNIYVQFYYDITNLSEKLVESWICTKLSGPSEYQKRTYAKMNLYPQYCSRISNQIF